MSALGLCATLMHMQFYDLPVSGSITLVSQQSQTCSEMQKSVFCDKVLCLITQKSYSVTIMLVNAIWFFWLFACVCKSDHTCDACTGWILANSPQRERFYFLRNVAHSSAHIWLLCAYYSQWPNQRFAHSFRPSALQCCFLGLVTEPLAHSYIQCFCLQIKLIPSVLHSVVNWCP